MQERLAVVQQAEWNEREQGRRESSSDKTLSKCRRKLYLLPEWRRSRPTNRYFPKSVAKEWKSIITGMKVLLNSAASSPKRV